MPATEYGDRIEALQRSGHLPAKFGRILEGFAETYRTACLAAGLSEAAHDRLFSGFLDLLGQDAVAGFEFAPYHAQITAPFDYYTFGVEFLRPLVDKRASRLRGLDHIQRAADAISAGENVVFFANHQTEGDPQAISLLLEDHAPALGREMIFIAGERVTTDPLAVPFSMGRNLLCIYSKRYIESPPELRAAKQHHNRRTMEKMAELLATGGRCIYVAPAGGRDRRDPSGGLRVAPFDPQSVEMIALMAERAGRPCHFFPMALATYDFLPPPESIRMELGETRDLRRSGIGLAVGAEIEMASSSECEGGSRRAKREARATAIWKQVCDEYARIRSAD